MTPTSMLSRSLAKWTACLTDSMSSPAAPYSFEAGGETFHIRLANRMEDRLRVWNFVHQVYVGKGYANDEAPSLWYGIHDALPSTLTFMAERDGHLIASLSLVFDSPIRLPADALYADELSRLRAAGRRPCEIVSFVSVEKQSSAAVKLIKHLFKLAYLAAYHLEEATDFIITVHPHHKGFYRRGMLFEQVGEERIYGKVNGTPAIFLRLDLAAARDLYQARFGHYEDERNLHRFFLDREEEWTHWIRRQRRTITPVEFAEHFSRNPAIKQKCPPEQMDYVCRQYNARPEISFGPRLDAAAC